MDTNELKTYIIETILQRLDENSTSRQEALQEFMGVSMPSVGDGSASSVSRLIPELPRSIYEKWAGLFADRLLETVPRDQVEELCSGTDDNTASLSLVYLMFMESERMEKQIAADLHALGVEMSAMDDAGNALGCYFRARLAAQKSPMQ
ncbi:MAG: hypothetical protein R3Y11_01940 [Pseudomonadota bacterium]